MLGARCSPPGVMLLIIANSVRRGASHTPLRANVCECVRNSALAAFCSRHGEFRRFCSHMFDTSGWSIDDVHTTENRFKVARVWGPGGVGTCGVSWALPSKATAPNGALPTVRGDVNPTRFDLKLRIDDTAVAAVRELDEWAIKYISEHSARLLDKEYTVDEVRASYISPLKVARNPRLLGPPPLLLIKYDTSGKDAVLCFKPGDDNERLPTPSPHEWLHRELEVDIRISHLWFAREQFGLVLKMKQVELYPVVVANRRLEAAPKAAPRTRSRSLHRRNVF